MTELGPVVRLALAAILGFAPFAVVTRLLPPADSALHTALALALLVPCAAYATVAMLAVVRTERWADALPHIVVPALARALPQALLPAAALVLGVALPAFGTGPGAEPTLEGAISGRSSFRVPAIVIVAFDVYASLVYARLTGLLGVFEARRLRLE